VLELPMTSARSNFEPAGVLQQANDVPHFHRGTLAVETDDRYLRIQSDRADLSCRAA